MLDDCFCLIYRPLEVASWFIFTTTQSAMNLSIRGVIKIENTPKAVRVVSKFNCLVHD